MIINLRTLDCLINSPCQSHWNYIDKYGGNEFLTLAYKALRTSTKGEANQGKAIETIKAKKSGKKRL